MLHAVKRYLLYTKTYLTIKIIMQNTSNDLQDNLATSFCLSKEDEQKFAKFMSSENTSLQFQDLEIVDASFLKSVINNLMQNLENVGKTLKTVLLDIDSTSIFNQQTTVISETAGWSLCTIYNIQDFEMLAETAQEVIAEQLISNAYIDAIDFKNPRIYGRNDSDKIWGRIVDVKLVNNLTYVKFESTSKLLDNIGKELLVFRAKFASIQLPPSASHRFNATKLICESIALDFEQSYKQ